MNLCAVGSQVVARGQGEAVGVGCSASGWPQLLSNHFLIAQAALWEATGLDTVPVWLGRIAVTLTQTGKDLQIHFWKCRNCQHVAVGSSQCVPMSSYATHFFAMGDSTQLLLILLYSYIKAKLQSTYFILHAPAATMSPCLSEFVFQIHEVLTGLWMQTATDLRLLAFYQS